MGQPATHSEWSVLVVDDEVVDRQTFRRAVSKTPFVRCLGEAASIREAREMLATERPDCVVVDMRLPDGEGLELVSDFPRLPFIVMTGFDDSETAQRALQSGAQDYLVKGALSPEMIVRSIRYSVERQAHQAALQALAHQDRLASLGQLSASVAHEINNPVAFVAANLSLFREQNGAYGRLMAELTAIAADDPRIAKLLEAHPLPLAFDEVDSMLLESATGTERIVSIVRQLGTFARGPEADEALSEVSLTEVAKWAIALTQKTLEARATLVLELEEGLPSFVGRPGQLSQVATNLLVNACQAIPSGSSERHEIRVRTSRRDSNVVLTVEDSGPGFDDTALSRAFEPFYTTKAQGEGTGLGLAIVREIVRSHRGEIELENRPEGGARVTVRIPRDTGLTFRKVATAKPPPLLEEREEFRILLIDDEPAIRRAYSRMLRPHDVVWESGTGALKRLLEDGDTDFDLVLCDLMMPDVDGMTLYGELAVRAPSLVPKIVFLTGGVFEDSAREFLESIPNRVLLKPVTRDQILLAAETVVRVRHSLPPPA